MSSVAVANTAKLGSVQGMSPADISQARDVRGGVMPGGPDFREALTKASQISGLNTNVLPGAAAQVANPAALKFSAHAVDRMKSRGIAISPNEMKSIENAVERAASKGSRDTLVLAGDNALIVSVKNKTVVTVMDRSAMRDNVFTNIDSTVVV